MTALGDVGPPGPGGRPVAPGGWRRALIGFVVGLAAGALVALVLPRDDGPRRLPPGQRALDLDADRAAERR